MATTNNVSIHLPYQPRDAFIPFHARSERFAVIVAHRRAGKTESCLAELVNRALNNPFEDSMYAYMAPFMGQAKRVAWKRLQKACGKELLKLCKVSETTSVITLPNGASIHILGADNYEALRGSGWDGIVLDEAGDMHPHVWGQVIRPALMDRLGWAVFIGTPKGHNFFHKQHVRALANKSGDWFHLMLKGSTSGILDPAEYQSICDELDEDDIAQELECSFEAATKGSYYGKIIEKMEAEGRLDALKFVRAAPVHLAFDIGIRDDTACWFYQITNGHLNVLNHFSESGMGMDETIDLVLEKAEEFGYKLGDWYLPHDAAAREWQTGKTAIEQLWAKGYNVKRVPSESVYSGIQAVRHTLPKMWIDSLNCRDGVEALKHYQKAWNDKSGSFARTPLHDWSSHSADAMRYLCLAVRDQDLTASAAKPTGGRRTVPGLTVEAPIQAPQRRDPVNKDEVSIEERERKAEEAFHKELLELSGAYADDYARI